uniref:Reverse transcriptase domain-containing protein n=1 Tax=Tanacetum cinerariifolium TaxID=118510 RepID=A0A6L2MQN5_TANCI|nr:hypothetical protein [Tanacetum cinerariifolium]
MSEPSPSHLNDDKKDKSKNTDGENDLEAHYINAKPLGKPLRRKEKDPGSFTLPCFINNMCFNKALADLGAIDYIRRILRFGIQRIVTCTVVFLIVCLYCRGEAPKSLGSGAVPLVAGSKGKQPMASWINNMEDHSSTSGWIFLLGGGLEGYYRRFIANSSKVAKPFASLMQNIRKDFDSEIRYHPRKANVVSDALSRKERVKPRRHCMEGNVGRPFGRLKLEKVVDLGPSWHKRQPTRAKVGDKVMLDVSSWKDVVHFGKKGMLAPRYEYWTDVNMHVPLEEIKVHKTLHFVEEPIEIFDREAKSLKRSSISIVKAYWDSKRVKSRDEISLRRGYCDKCALSRLCARLRQVAEHQVSFIVPVLICFLRMEMMQNHGNVPTQCYGLDRGYACSDSLLLTPLCCDDIHLVTPRVSALAGCDNLVIKESLVKTKQKGAILELKQRYLKNIILCNYTPYPTMKIRRISASSAQETRND